MRKVTILIIFTTIAFNAFSQDDNIQHKLDSIVKEADLLYNYEKAVWISTDLFIADKKLRKNYGGYVVYHSNDTISVVFINKTQKERIAKYSFINSDLNNPVETNFEVSKLNSLEQELLDIKIKIINQLSDSKYEVSIPNGFNPNFVLIKEKSGFKLYILMGTNKTGIIPFGNDYLFRADLNGNIISWKKFHSRMIPAQSEIPGVGKVTSATHSHLRTTPYITATDICTFRLYAQFTGFKEFQVYSPAIGKYMKYDLEKNKIELID